MLIKAYDVLSSVFIKAFLFQKASLICIICSANRWNQERAQWVASDDWNISSENKG